MNYRIIRPLYGIVWLFLTDRHLLELVLYHQRRTLMILVNLVLSRQKLGFGEYRFRKSEAALIHAHLVFLAYILLHILRYRLLSYTITKAVPSMEFVITWVRKKTRQGFIHYIWDKLKQGTSIRSLIVLLPYMVDILAS